jgi:hypothetical protein
MEKVYVSRNNQVKIICPKCELEKNINVFKFKNTHKRLKAKCKCGEEFRLSLEFRKYYRKNAQLTGEYYIRGKNEEEEILTKDISKTGIKFTTLNPHHFYEYDLVELKFTLNDTIRTEIRTRAKILWINDRTVGAQFNDPQLLEKDLVLYMIK